MKRIHCAMSLILMVIGLTPVFADSVQQDKCMVAPLPPTTPMVLAGQPKARLYIHPKHPGLCGDPESKDCKPKGYVLTGDRISVGERCGDWVYMAFEGKKTRTLGWVDSSLYASSPPPEQSLNAACGEAAKLFNQWLNNPEPAQTIIPSALSNKQDADVLPAGTGGGGGPNVWSIKIADAHIAGKPIKGISYGSGGTCHDDSLELWDPDFKKQITIPTNGTDDLNAPVDPGDATGYSYEDLVLLQGKPYFMHVPRSTNNVKLWAFQPDMTATPMCEVARFPAETEIVTYSADNALCEAVVKGQIKDAGLSATEPLELTDAAAIKALGINSFGGADVLVIAVGKVDLYNTGKPESLEMLQYGASDGAGCGHTYAYQWPAVLSAQGQPLRAVDHDPAFEHAGNISRLITFHGVTYFDTRADDSTDALPFHEVWKLTSTGATRMCRLNSVEYRAIPVPPPQPHS